MPSMGQYGSVIFSGVRNGGGIDNTRQGGIPEGTDNLVEVLVDLGELGRELLVLEVYTLLVENLCHRGDEIQPVINGEKLQTGELGVQASQVPEIDTVALFEVSSKFTHMA